MQSKIKRGMWLVILLAVVAGLGFPEAGPASLPSLTWWLMGLMFLGSLDIRVSALVHAASPVHHTAIVFFITLFFLPIVLCLTRDLLLTGLSSDVRAGFYMVAAAPSGMSVVFMTAILGGLPQKALLFVAVSNLISPIYIPWVASLAGAGVRMDFWAMVQKLALVVFLPVLAGIVLPERMKSWVRHRSGMLGAVMMFPLIYVLIAAMQPVLFADYFLSLHVSLLSVLLITITYQLGKATGTDRAEKTTFALAAGFRNFSLTGVAAMTSISPEAAIPSVVYAVLSNLLLVPLQWRRRDIQNH